MPRPPEPLTILHSSDWHLGRSLYGRRRYEEFRAFLDWLAGRMEEERVDALLLAGDVFDSSAPGTRAQELYYGFLCRVARSCCRHIVVIAGNHDSPSFLNAPRELLRSLNVHVLGAVTGNPEDEVLVLRNEADAPELIVCAVPFLRERDIRLSEAGESLEDKDRKACHGVSSHYEEIISLAGSKNAALGGGIPIIVMGHLFVAGGQTAEGDGVRELQVGSLSRVPGDIFPDSLDYVALGHLHVPQTVNGRERARYSGSPLPMGFGEAGQAKSVCLLRCAGENRELRLLPVPAFQKLEQIRGGLDTILARLSDLALSGANAWLEIIYEGEEVAAELRGQLEEAIAGTPLEILRISNRRLAEKVLGQGYAGESLADLEPLEVFDLCLEAHHIPEEQLPELKKTYAEALAALHEDPGEPA